MNDHSKENNAADTDEQGIPCSDSDTMEFNQKKRIKEARSLLRTIQISTLNYLKPILKCREGKPDSAFCSLLNLISQDEQLKNLFTVEYSWIRRCETCTTPIVRNYKKTIITLSRVRSFFPCSPISLCICPVCKSPDQTVHLEYITLPQCFIFHFENGADTNSNVTAENAEDIPFIDISEEDSLKCETGVESEKVFFHISKE
ncbi:SUMO-specific isopeptidase USPL1 [Caerostris extrusa]|uniref:SUMO-specific isopeptidase USPL1 n=1 Tax=Caerostris extrusa TaxID=172846 RepID=A0AAV4NBP4_CAEEX|nr:SUMO-specific isopeptidase USPL1 [Caerostris extrusa]